MPEAAAQPIAPETAAQGNIIDLFLANAARTPDKTAIHFRDRTLSYTEVLEQTRRLSALLNEMGIGQGDAIVVLLDNGIEFSLLLLAAAECGAMLAPLSPTLSTSAIRTAFASTGARFVIGAPAPLRKLFGEGETQAPVEPARALVVGGTLAGCRHFGETEACADRAYTLGTGAAPAELDYILTMTSGSTGAPKPIALSQATKIARSLAGARDLYGVNAADVIITASPMYHSLGMRLALLPLLVGATAVILDKFAPAAWVKAVQTHRVTFAIMVSSHLELILNELEDTPGDLSSLRSIVSSSALLKPETKQACIERFDCEFHECYGASEVGIVTNLAPADGRANLASVGRALPYVELAIVDAQRNPLPPGETGEIACRSLTRFSRYFNNDAATRESLVDGWFYTGDVGYLDSDGYLYLCGRKKDIIIVGGTNVYPEDIETVLQAQPGVADCAVIGVEDAYFGEAVLAVIVPADDGVDMHALRTACARHLADYQQPMAYEQVGALPRNALGKIMRHRLRERFEGYDATAMLRRLMG